LQFDFDVTVVGAGPYGLSAGSHLEASGLRVRVFGDSMSFWAKTMPKGMLLRSPRAASTISDPNGDMTLEAYEAATKTPAAAPVPLSTFVSYGKWFEQKLGENVDRRSVASVASSNSHFDLTLADGARLTSRAVVIAAGIGPFFKKPSELASLAPDLASHCYEGRPIAEFAGKRVVVIGAGQSALESAALLSEAGSDVEVLARRAKLRWIGQHGWLHHLGPLSSLLYARHDVGPMGISRLVAYPQLLAKFPRRIRERIRRRAIRAAGSAWLPARLRRVTLTTGRTVTAAEAVGREVRLRLDDGSERRVDHVLLGTGYRIDVAQYSFLSRGLSSRVRLVDGWPVLSGGLRSSVPGLHFVGAPAAGSFGPLLHFVAGTEFASRALTASLVRTRIHG
jgi:pyruvate/2-oxoglutarate dehydrogenase complex dihydrolipoamide dehydrogenase (E3) component